MNVRVSTKTNVDEGIGSSKKTLPFGSTTRVRVDALGRQLLLYLNESLDSNVTVSSERIFGDALLYVSDPWNPAMSGTISPISMTTLTS